MERCRVRSVCPVVACENSHQPLLATDYTDLVILHRGEGSPLAASEESFRGRTLRLRTTAKDLLGGRTLQQFLESSGNLQGERSRGTEVAASILLPQPRQKA